MKQTGDGFPQEKAKKSLQDIVDDRHTWGRYISSLVCDFHICPDVAWQMTVREYWMLHGYKYVDGKETKARPVSTDEAQELIETLKAKGVDVSWQTNREMT